MQTPYKIEIGANNVEDLLTQVARVVEEEAAFARKHAEARRQIGAGEGPYYDEEANALFATKAKVEEAQQTLATGIETARQAYHESLFPKNEISVAAGTTVVIPPGEYEQVEPGGSLYKRKRGKE